MDCQIAPANDPLMVTNFLRSILDVVPYLQTEEAFLRLPCLIKAPHP